MHYPVFLRLLIQASDPGMCRACPESHMIPVPCMPPGLCWVSRSRAKPTCSSWHCCRAAAPCPRSRRCSRTGSHLRHTCRRAPGIYPSKRTWTEDQDLCSEGEQRMLAASRHPWCTVRAQRHTSLALALARTCQGTVLWWVQHGQELALSPLRSIQRWTPHPIPSSSTAALTLQVWQRPPWKSGWKVAGFLLPQDRQLAVGQTDTHSVHAGTAQGQPHLCTHPTSLPNRQGKQLPSRLPLLFVTSETICSL